MVPYEPLLSTSWVHHSLPIKILNIFVTSYMNQVCAQKQFQLMGCRSSLGEMQDFHKLLSLTPNVHLQA